MPSALPLPLGTTQAKPAPINGQVAGGVVGDNVPSTSDKFAFTIAVAWKDRSWRELRLDTVKTWSAPTAGWTEAATALVAPANADHAVLRLATTSLAAPMYVDDVVFRPQRAVARLASSAGTCGRLALCRMNLASMIIMQLFCNGELFGTLTDYAYETPWASARITPQDGARFSRLCLASRFLDDDIEQDWGELSPEAEDREYARRLAGYGISDADIAMIRGGSWEIRAAQRAEWNGPIHVYRCSSDGWVEWRW